jgi:hypothetical protein
MPCASKTPSRKTSRTCIRKMAPLSPRIGLHDRHRLGRCAKRNGLRLFFGSRVASRLSVALFPHEACSLWRECVEHREAECGCDGVRETVSTSPIVEMFTSAIGKSRLSLTSRSTSHASSPLAPGEKWYCLRTPAVSPVAFVRGDNNPAGRTECPLGSGDHRNV